MDSSTLTVNSYVARRWRQSESSAGLYPASRVELGAPGHYGIRASGANR
jgi:hypothetical protein